MRSPIIKTLIIAVLALIPLFVSVPKVEAQYTKVIALQAPDMVGMVLSTTGAGIGGVWVRWQDNNGNIRYTLTQSDGSYFFESWQNIHDSGRADQYYNTWIDTDLDGVVDSRMVSTTGGDGFGCTENPHTITVVKPYNWSGSFSTAIFGDINNDWTKQQFPDLVYTPGPNSASCISIDVPSQVTAGQSFSATVQMKNNNIPSQWTETNLYRLGRWDGNGNSDWIFPDVNQDRVYLPYSVNGGDTATFNFNVTAPNTTGTKNLDVRMIQDGREWFGDICSKQIQIQAQVHTLTGPSIQGINIKNGGGGGSAVRTSGLGSTQGGTGYNNPLTITLNAIPGKNSDGSDTNATYYMAFYDKSGGAITSSSSFLTTVTSRLDSNKANGFLLAYDNTGTRCNGGNYCVYDGNKWVNISGSNFGAQGYPVKDSSGKALLTVYPGNDQDYGAERQWRLKFDKNFGSKSMYTAAYVVDINNQSDYTKGGDKTPTTQ